MTDRIDEDNRGDMVAQLEREVVDLRGKLREATGRARSKSGAFGVLLWLFAIQFGLSLCQNSNLGDRLKTCNGVEATALKELVEARQLNAQLQHVCLRPMTLDEYKARVVHSEVYGGELKPDGSTMSGPATRRTP